MDEVVSYSCVKQVPRSYFWGLIKTTKNIEDHLEDCWKLDQIDRYLAGVYLYTYTAKCKKCGTPMVKQIRTTGE